MNDDEISELIEEVQPLTASHVAEVACSLNLQDSYTYDSVEFKLREYFRLNPTVPAVILLVAGRSAGIVTPASLDKNAGKMAGDASVSQTAVSERSLLPGTSTKYKLLEFTCAKCTRSEYRIYYDDRDIPNCPHGKMKLRRESR